MIPAEFTGVWRRVSIAIGDRAPEEPSEVVWVQARRAFADLRLPRRPGTEAVAFAGVTTWDPPRLAWEHRLDLEPEPAGTDVGVVEWRGDDLVERGTLGDSDVAYEEVWRRESGLEPPIVVLERADGRGSIVRVGDHAIVMAQMGTGTAVRHDVLAADHWLTVGELGDTALLPSLPPTGSAWTPGLDVELPGFGTWCVRELER